MNHEPIVIAGFARTPMGGMQGALSSVPATRLGSIAIKAAVERAKVDPADVDQVIMGCVLPGALGQAPARQASIGAGLPISTGATTVNKVCGSGMKATMMAAEVDPRRHVGHRRRGRHGIDDQRPVHADQASRRCAHRT